MGYGLADLHLKDTHEPAFCMPAGCEFDKLALTGEWFTLSRNWLALGGTISPASARPQM